MWFGYPPRYCYASFISTYVRSFVSFCRSVPRSTRALLFAQTGPAGFILCTGLPNYPSRFLHGYKTLAPTQNLKRNDTREKLDNGESMITTKIEAAHSQFFIARSLPLIPLIFILYCTIKSIEVLS